MKLKFLCQESNYKYSLLGRRFERTFENSGLGLTLSHEIYNIKLRKQEKPEISFSDFLQNFYYPEANSEFPHYLPVPTEIYQGDLNKPSRIFNEPNTSSYLTQLSDTVFNNHSILNLIIGNAGAGKTSVFMAIANQCRQKNKSNKLSEFNFLTCYLNINNVNKNSLEEIISYSTGNKTFKNLDEYLGNSFPVIFFIDANSITQGIGESEVVFENKLTDLELLKIVTDLKSKLETINRNYNNRHKLFVIYRVNFHSAKSGNDNFFNKLNQYSATTWLINPLEIESVYDYILNISKETGKAILENLDQSNGEIITTPLFADFLNWLALQLDGETLKDYKINSISHLYLIFTREYLRNEYKQWENKDWFPWMKKNKVRDRILSWKEKEFATSYTGAKYYSLEEKPNQFELLLMVIVNKFGLSFRDDLLGEELEKIVKDESYEWLADYWEWFEENKDNKGYIAKRKINEEIFIKNGLLKYSGGADLEFFHSSIGIFYQAKSMFYNLEKGVLISLENKEHYEKVLNNCIYWDVFSYFITLLDLYLKKQKDQIQSQEYFSMLELTEFSIFNLGVGYYVLNEYSQGFEMFQKVIEINPNNDLVYHALGDTYSDLKEYTKAIENYNKAVEINPNYDLAYYGLGDTYSDLKEYSQAIDNYNKALEVNPNYSSVYQSLGNAYYYLQEYSQAIENYNKAIEINPNDDFNYNNLGITYYRLKEYTKAVDKYLKAIELNPGNALAYENLVNVYLDLKEYENVIEVLKKSIEFNPNNDSAYYNLGFSYYELKEYTKAIEMLKKMIEISPNDDNAFVNLGNLYLELKDYSKAIEYTKKAIEINPTDIAFHNLGESHYLINDLEKAIEYFEKALELNSEYSESHKYLGIIYKNNNDFKKAKEHFQKAVDLNPEDEEVREYLEELN